MRKSGNIIFWVIVIVVSMFALYSVYNKYKPDNEIRQQPPLSRQETPEDPGATNQPQDETDTPEANPQKVMAPDFSLTDMNGNTVSLSDYKGKIVFINFWTTWCRYCVDEMPDLDSAASELRDLGDAVIIAVNVQESLEKVKKFVTEREFSLEVLMDFDGAVAQTYRVEGYPTTYVINRDGTYYGYQVGPVSKKGIMDLVEKIK